MTHRRSTIPVSIAVGLAALIVLLWLSSSTPTLATAAPRCNTDSGGVITVCLGGGCDFGSIQDAVDAALEGDTIKVAAGTYTDISVRPRNDITSTGVVTQVAYISKTITIRGGYTTTNGFAEPPDPEANPTTLDAQNQGRVLYITGFVSPTIEGLRITRGDATGLGGHPDGPDAGGGVFLYGGAITATDNLVFGNTAGGGPGGGFGLIGCNATLDGNTLSGNSAGSEGGGVHTYHANVTLRNNDFVDNDSAWRGGGLLTVQTTCMLEDNSFVGNTADSEGGGMYIWGSSATLIGNEILSNTATDNGGGVYFAYNTQELVGNTVANNVAGNSGGGLLLLVAENTRLVNNMIVNNSAGGTGSGIYIGGTQPHLIHNTIADNPGAAGVYLTNAWEHLSTATFTNTIVANHAVGIRVDTNNQAVMESTLWNGNGTNWEGAVTHSNDHPGDPAFVDASGGDYHIGPTSAAIDKGTDAGVDDDIDGDLRPAGDGYDLGADEYLPAWFELSKVAVPAAVQVADLISYTFRITNTGPLTLHAVVTDVLPQYVTTTSPLTWTPVITSPGGTWSEELVVTVETGCRGPITNVVRVTTDEGPARVYTTVTEFINQAPFAHAGADQAVDEGELVLLDGSGSTDLDGHLPLIYWWQQSGGPTVHIIGADEEQAAFEAPTHQGVLTFTLAVTDGLGLGSSPDVTVVSVGVEFPVYLPLVMRQTSGAP